MMDMPHGLLSELAFLSKSIINYEMKDKAGTLARIRGQTNRTINDTPSGGPVPFK
jgi:hypothetical protein